MTTPVPVAAPLSLLVGGVRRGCTFVRTEPTRAQDEARDGRPFFSEPGLVVVTEVTLATMEAAARALASERFFDLGAPDRAP